MLFSFVKFSFAFLLLFAFVSTSFASPALRIDSTVDKKPVAQNRFQPSEKAWKWADKKLKKMSSDEKIGQLVHIGINARFLNQDSNEFQDLKRQVTENKIGGIIVFVGGVYETVHLVNRMQEFAETPLSDFRRL